VDQVFNQANQNKEMDIVGSFVAKKEEGYVNEELVKKIE
jgi:hypothetical protein